MRFHRYPSLMAVLAVLSFCPPGTAQKFQEPTQDELKMTSDAMAPGAPAVYLYREEVTDNDKHFVSQYARIKVLTERGMNWSVVHISFRPELDGKPMVEGRTIHPDGSVYPLAESNVETVEVPQGGATSHEVKVALPNVTVGSILEYRWTRPLIGANLRSVADFGEAAKAEARASLFAAEIASRTPDWIVQRHLFIHHERFYFHPFNALQLTPGSDQNRRNTKWVNGERANYLLYTRRLPPGVEVAKSPNGDYSLDIHNVPAIPQEPDGPPDPGLSYRVRFFLTPYVDSDAYWDNEINRWSKELDELTAVTPALSSAVQQTTTGANSVEAKARALYDAVQRIEYTDYTKSPMQTQHLALRLRTLKRPDEVWGKKSGNSAEIAVLYLALLRAAGIEADGLAVTDRSRALFDPSFLSFDQFHALLVGIRVNGATIYLDPGEKLCPFGQLSWKHTLTGGIEQNVRAPINTPANSLQNALSRRSAELTIDAAGAATGSFHIEMNGPAALYWRQLNLTAGPDETQKQFQESLSQALPQGIGADAVKIEGLNTAAGNLSVTGKLTGRLGKSEGSRVSLPAFFFTGDKAVELVPQENRESLVDLHYAEQVIDEVLYRLPMGYAVEGAPQAIQLPWPGHAALVVTVFNSPGSVAVKRNFGRSFALLAVKEYPALRVFYQRVAANDQQQLVIAPLPSQK